MRRAYQVITDRIVSLLEEGTVPWHRPWGGPARHPKNLVSGRGYRGINVFMLSSAGYESPYWLTFRQAQSRDGHVKKGEKGYPCIYWNWVERRNEKTGEEEKHPFLKYYTVFNVEQCQRIEYPAVHGTERTFSPIAACEQVVEGMPRAPPIRHGGGRACYRPRTDEIRVPTRAWFDGDEHYYSVLFHELVHSTGHRSRIGRVGVTEPIEPGSRQYSKEELIAEMGATFLCGHTGIENTVIDNSASYIATWLRHLRGDPRLVVQAAAQSQKAADYILNRSEEECTKS